MKKYLLVLLSISLMNITACQDQKKPSETQQNQKINDALSKEFEEWKAQQDPKLLQEYENFLAENLENPPSLFELSFNTHIRRAECLQYRFALADKSQWKNIVAPLKLIESLKSKGLIENYKVTSVYRDKRSNECGQGASRSKHLGNYAVDFKVLNAQGLPYAKDDLSIQKKLCDYWKKMGVKQKMGLGTYAQHQFHIDVQGYRTWGSSYQRASSACLTQP